MFLNCHSYFSLKYGTLSIERLLGEAKKNNINRIALTDINNTSGVLDFVRLAPKYHVFPVVGIDFRNGAQQQFICIAKNNEGFRELNELLTHHLQTEEPIPPHAPAFEKVFVIYPFGKQPPTLNENEFIGIRPADINKLLFSKLKNQQEKLVALFTVTVSTKIDFNIHRLLRAVANNTLLSKLSKTETADETEVMMTEADAQKIFARFPFLIDNANKLLEQCSIDFDFGKSKNKKQFTVSVESDMQQLRKLSYDALKYRYENVDGRILERLEKELCMIHEGNFASYFLINHDIVSFAQQKTFFYIGRGSGANSMVAYLLRITDVDPIDLDLYFERFINPSRTSPPDFDLDFSWKDRDEVIAFILNKYGKNYCASMLATYSEFKANAVIRELGKVFGLPKNEIDSLADNFKRSEPSHETGKLIYRYVERLYGFPAHLGIHAGGILISEKPLTYYTALSNPPKGFPVSQFSMIEAEDVGLYKFDILSQRGLGHIKDTVEIVKQNRNIEIDIHDIKKFKQDENMKANLRDARCMGCFYIESPAMRMLLKKLEVDNYLSLVAASSIIRPGVASSGMMREYIVRHRDASQRTYIHPFMQELMAETYGIMVYQEDVIKVAHYFAGLTLTEADMLRRGMSGKFRGREEFDKVKENFFANCDAKGYERKITAEVWRQIESFAGYAFSKGHSASYAVESYQSLFLKTYYPKEFMVGVINNFGGFYHTEFYVHEARMSGANIHAPDINRSNHLTTITGDDIFLGFIHLAEMEATTSQRIEAEQKLHGAFLGLEDFCNRVNCTIDQLRILVRIGAFRFTGRSKKQLLWDIHTVLGNEKHTTPHPELFAMPPTNFTLPILSHHQLDDALDEIELLGFPLCSPFDLLKGFDTVPSNINSDVAAVPLSLGEGLGVRLAHDLKNHNGKIVVMIGYLVTTKYTRTKRGDEMRFGTWLDRNGFFFDTTHFPNETKLFPFRGRGCYRITGRVAEEFGFYSLEVTAMHKLDFITREDLMKQPDARDMLVA